MIKRITIRDVASRAGVSSQTVSRVLNDRPDVSDETRQRVKQVIKELGYHPSNIARSLISNKTYTLGLITADFSDYFFTQVIVGAEAEARKNDYFFILCSTEHNPADEPEYFRLLTERNVDGILFARPSTEKDDRHIASLIRQGMPLVTTAYFVPGEQMTVVDVDNIDGGHRATMCLIDAGHRHIAMIAGPDWKSANERSQGYHLALDQANLPYDDALVRAGDWSYHSGYQAMKSLLAQAPHLTALFAHNDQMAIGAIRAVLESGRLIPDDVAVVGYDDIPAASYSYPPLTTIHQPMQEVGHIATQLLIETINNPGMEPKEVLLETELIRRASCGSAHDVASQNFGRT